MTTTITNDDDDEAREQWLRQCYENWTTSRIQTEAWRYRGDYQGFCRWFLSLPEGNPNE